MFSHLPYHLVGIKGERGCVGAKERMRSRRKTMFKRKSKHAFLFRRLYLISHQHRSWLHFCNGVSDAQHFPGQKKTTNELWQDNIFWLCNHDVIQYHKWTASWGCYCLNETNFNREVSWHTHNLVSLTFANTWRQQNKPSSINESNCYKNELPSWRQTEAKHLQPHPSASKNVSKKDQVTMSQKD